MRQLCQYLFVFAASALCWGCGDKSEDVKNGSTGALRSSPAEVDRLINQLGSEDFAEREAAGKALEAAGEPAVKALQKAATESSDAEVRRRATEVIGALEARLFRELRCYEDPAGGCVFSVAFSPDGKRVLSGGHITRLWDVETGKELHQFGGKAEVVWAVAYSPDGKRAISGGKAARLWDVATGKEVRRLKIDMSVVKVVEHVAFTPDGKRALLGCHDRTLRLCDVENGEELRCFKGHTKAIAGVAFIPDGKKALSGAWDNTIRLWDVATGEEVRCFQGVAGSVCAVAISRDGQRVLLGGSDDKVRLWDVATGKELLCLEGHTESVLSVALSPDGKRALSGGFDKTVRLWDLDGGKELRCLKGHKDAVCGLAFSPDGKRALSGSQDGTVRLWPLSVEPGTPADRPKCGGWPKDGSTHRGEGER
jgi:WD40 repeat protein